MNSRGDRARTRCRSQRLLGLSRSAACSTTIPVFAQSFLELITQRNRSNRLNGACKDAAGFGEFHRFRSARFRVMWNLPVGLLLFGAQTCSACPGRRCEQTEACRDSAVLETDTSPQIAAMPASMATKSVYYRLTLAALMASQSTANCPPPTSARRWFDGTTSSELLNPHTDGQTTCRPKCRRPDA